MLNSDGTEVTDAMLIKVGEMSDPDINTGIIKKMELSGYQEIIHMDK